jgi:ABC-2 type transport system permease protein
MSDAGVFAHDLASMTPCFNVIKWIFIFILPAFAMRSIAEEKRYGTLEFLLTKPIRTNQLIAGKFLTLVAFVIIILILTLPYYFTMIYLGDTDSGQALCGYMGLLLAGTAYGSISLFSSSVSRNSISAFLLGFILILIFQFFFGMISEITNNYILSEIFLYLSIDEHLDPLLRGIVDSRDLIYFLSLSAIFLFLTRMSIVKMRY